MTAFTTAYPSAPAGNDFTDQLRLSPYHTAANRVAIVDSAGTGANGTSTAFFTELARRGLQDQTNWTADTYKTILSASGPGFFSCYIGCTAGGVETHTLELTLDGVLTTMTITPMASGERAFITTAYAGYTPYSDTPASNIQAPISEALDSNKQIFGSTQGTSTYVMPWWSTMMTGVPLLRWSTSILIRAKHSATITNSTATAYSAVMYRLGLTA